MILSKKIQSSRITEKEYRAIKGSLSYSSLKKYDSDRSAWYKENILGEIPKDKDTVSKTLGSMVHSILAGDTPDSQEFNDKFHILQCKPLSETTHMYKLVDNLFSRSLKSLNEYGEQQDKFEVIFNDAFHQTKYNYNNEEVAFKGKDIAQVLTMFQKDGEAVYKEKMDCVGKTVVSVSQIEQAEKLVNKLKEHPYTYEIVNARTEGNVEVFCELPIEFTIDGVKCKCLPDKMRVDHTLKIIDIWDWKTSWQSDSPEKVYTSYGYYIQLGIYDYGVKEWAKEHGLEGYKVNPVKFVFIDVQGFMAPVILQPTQDDIQRAWRGFSVSGRVYTGITEILNEIAWSVETGIWNSSKLLHEANGVTRLTLRYGSR